MVLLFNNLQLFHFAFWHQHQLCTNDQRYQYCHLPMFLCIGISQSSVNFLVICIRLIFSAIVVSIIKTNFMWMTLLISTTISDRSQHIGRAVLIFFISAGNILAIGNFLYRISFGQHQADSLVFYIGTDNTISVLSISTVQWWFIFDISSTDFLFWFQQCWFSLLSAISVLSLVLCSSSSPWTPNHTSTMPQ